MKHGGIIKVLSVAGCILAFMICVSIGTYAQDAISDEKLVPEGVYIKLTKDFYEALRNEGAYGTKVYTNDPSHEYLKQIATSTRFMVETNLEIIKQQERSINLLRSLLKDQKK